MRPRDPETKASKWNSAMTRFIYFFTPALHCESITSYSKLMLSHLCVSNNPQIVHCPKDFFCSCPNSTFQARLTQIDVPSERMYPEPQRLRRCYQPLMCHNPTNGSDCKVFLNTTHAVIQGWLYTTPSNNSALAAEVRQSTLQSSRAPGRLDPPTCVQLDPFISYT